MSFVFSFLPIVFIYSQLYQRFGRKPVTLRLFTRQTKKHTIIAECQIVSIHRKSYLQRFLHTLPFGAKKDPEPFLVRDLSKSIFSFLPTNWDFFYSLVASRYSSVPTSLQACLPAMMTLPLAYSYAYISIICGSESPSLSVAD